MESITPLQFGAYRKWLATRRNVVGMVNEITRTRMVFKWAYDARLIEAPVHFGQEFKKPSAKALRKHKRESGKKLLSAHEIQLLLDECGIHLRAMVYLGINAGMGNSELISLPLTAVNLSTGWIDFRRPKTEVDRLIPLWPETVEALEAS